MLPPAPQQRSTLASQPATRRLAARWIAHLVWTSACVGAGVVLGLALTGAALRHGGDVGARPVGAWRLSPLEGTPAINPYRRAFLARSAAIPMSAGQGLALTATRDDSGRKLDRHCPYSVGGPVPAARFWSLSVLDAEGRPIANAADRHAFTSDDVLRDAGGAFSVEISPEARPGNWIPLGGEGHFVLMLRLYDSPAAEPGFRTLSATAVPTITAGRCG